MPKRPDELQVDPTTGRYSRDDVKELVEGSGYPFEIRVFHAFRQASFAAGHGPVEVVDGRAIELDVLAHKDARVHGHECLTTLRVGTLVEAKVFHPPREFVGFESITPELQSRVGARYRVGGLPSWSIREGGVTLPNCHRDTQSTVEPLLDGVWCDQWGVLDGGPTATTTGNKPPAPKIHHPNLYRDAIEDTIRASHARELNVTETFSRELEAPNMSLEFPALVIDVPTLHVYNTERAELREVPWITLILLVEVGGSQRAATIDVLTFEFLPQYIKRLDEVLARFREAVEKNHVAFIEEAQKSRSGGVKIRIPSLRR